MAEMNHKWYFFFLIRQSHLLHLQTGRTCSVEGIRGMPIISTANITWTLSRQAETDMTALLYPQLTSSMSLPASTVKETESDYAALGRVV